MPGGAPGVVARCAATLARGFTDPVRTSGVQEANGTTPPCGRARPPWRSRQRDPDVPWASLPAVASGSRLEPVVFFLFKC